MREVEHLHGAGGVLVRVVGHRERRAPVGGVAREQLGGVLDHRLGVAGAATDRVQLEQLATLVLVGLVLHRLPVVEVEPHRRVQRAGDQEVLEPAERVLADRLVVVEAVRPGPVVADRDVQVGRPEVGHRLQHGALGVDPTQDAPVAEVVAVLPRRLGLGPVGVVLLQRRTTQEVEPAVHGGDLGRLGDGLRVPAAPRARPPGCRRRAAWPAPRWVNPVPNRFRYSRSRWVAAMPAGLVGRGARGRPRAWSPGAPAGSAASERAAAAVPAWASASVSAWASAAGRFLETGWRRFFLRFLRLRRLMMAIGDPCREVGWSVHPSVASNHPQCCRNGRKRPKRTPISTVDRRRGQKVCSGPGNAPDRTSSA